jgi:hypothetical protein
MNEKIKQIISRHIAKTLTMLELANIPRDVRSGVKSEFWFAAEDILSYLNENAGGTKDDTSRLDKTT